MHLSPTRISALVYIILNSLSGDGWANSAPDFHIYHVFYPTGEHSFHLVPLPLGKAFSTWQDKKSGWDSTLDWICFPLTYMLSGSSCKKTIVHVSVKEKLLVRIRGHQMSRELQKLKPVSLSDYNLGDETRTRIHN